MKFLLAAINAKYIHSNPAVYSLRAFAKEQVPGADVEIGEYTINNQMEHILQDIFRRKPDFVGFSCYIWNISHVLDLARDLHKVLPDCVIWLGGPEVSYDAAQVLEREPEIAGVMRGEGELTFAEVVKAYLEAGDGSLSQETDDISRAADDMSRATDPVGHTLAGIPGITYRDDAGNIHENVPQRLLSMDEVPFYYADMNGFENRIVYYESSRGCPFSCSYCLSSIDKSVRFRSLKKVRQELDFFLEHKVPQVKFVDRTFNCRKEHTMGIWQHILDHDNGITNFHFEVSADLFDEDELALIEKMRPGLIQLEIGVQSTNPSTIGEIRRNMNLKKLKTAVGRVQGYRNTHQHLDLIAGLPYEDMTSFLQSFDDVYHMKPDQLQLGFLKVLKGSYMASQAEAYELKYRGTPPYEVLSTRWLSYGDVIRLKAMEDMVEVHYNSGQFSYTIRLLEQEFPSPADMFLALADYYEEHGLFGLSHSRIARYEILYRFLSSRFAGSEGKLSRFRDGLMYDLYLRENVKSRPSFAGDQSGAKRRVREFFEAEEVRPVWLTGYEGYDSRQMSKMAHLEAMEDGSYLLFDYKNRDPLSKNARAVRFAYEERGNDGEKRDEKGQRPTGQKDSGAAGQGVWHRLPMLSEL